MKQKGFTLVELMVVIAILAITLVLGLPSFSNLIDSNRVTANTNTLVGALNLARMEAVNRGGKSGLAEPVEPQAGLLDIGFGLMLMVTGLMTQVKRYGYMKV
ncbi:prepilin-type N-terminal cleavage/methylation domain-containing protein [Hahella sp. KA22]|uniref:pilus assembly FimT family protein n=1 Tax=Hahella sp. KA22 TaxID=1628392 RepID=UPI000FDF372B|nr:prepilin-type N-terminal cleavage/methylation domain-containing protein [Hahella sp. KA22]AZZ94364.1 prepilin-type N-terminal cleavage/methylation domain-containing protein [Hahella sp. KA22]QAY57738.1 prepilin-type N-terminal cleavage/methylation domain-containing protein [Hahella sp. KA22]